MILNYNIHNKVSIIVNDPSDEISIFLEQELNEFSVSSLEKIDVEINFVKKIKIPISSIKLLKDFYYDNQKKCLFLERDGKLISYYIDKFNDGYININVEYGFSKWFILYAIEKSLYVLMGRKKCCMLHAGAIVENGKATVISALQAGGKTLQIINEVSNGAEFLGDDLIFVTENGECLSHPRRVNFNQFHGKHYDIASKIHWESLHLLNKIKWVFSKEKIKSLISSSCLRPTIRMSLSSIYTSIHLPKRVIVDNVLIKIHALSENHKASMWSDSEYCNFLLENMRYEVTSHITPYISSLIACNDKYIVDISSYINDIEEERKRILLCFLGSVSKKVECA